MVTIEGVMLTDYAHSDMTTKINGSKKASICLPEPYENGGCTNCNGGGTIPIAIYGDGPYEYPIGKCEHLDDGWYKVTRYAYPCPVCNGASSDGVIAAMKRDCGLTPGELEWRLEFIEGMEGKENALKAARKLLAMTPDPKGFLTVFGDYGVGKSGIAKSLVAAFVRAGVKSKYVRAAELLSDARQSMHGDGENALLWRLNRYKFLVIDEVDRIADTNYAMSTLFTMLDQRYNRRNSVATMLATNKFPDNMGDDWRYLMSRMEDGPRVPLGGITLRGAAARRLDL